MNKKMTKGYPTNEFCKLPRVDPKIHTYSESEKIATKGSRSGLTNNKHNTSYARRKRSTVYNICKTIKE
jgi:hypothetical protein